MAESHVISALVSKRSELAGLIQHHKKEMARLSEELSTMDKAIKVFDPEYRTQGIKPRQYRKPNIFFKAGEANKMLLDILRDAQGPMSTIDISEEAVKRKGLKLDADQLNKIKASIGNTLKSQARKGLIQELDKVNGVNVWAIL